MTKLQFLSRATPLKYIINYQISFLFSFVSVMATRSATCDHWYRPLAGAVMPFQVNKFQRSTSVHIVYRLVCKFSSALSR